MYYYTTTQAEEETPQEAPPAEQPRRRRRSGGPPFPPDRIWAAMTYVGQCQMSMQPFRKERAVRGPLEAEDYETSVEERDLHPAQISSYRAACDLLTSYFNGEGWDQPRGLRTREAYEEFIGILHQRRQAQATEQQ